MADMTTPPVTFAWTRRQVLVLVVLCLAALLDTIDVTVVNVAMPAIRESLHFSESGLSWMVNAYLVPFGGFLLLGGRAGDLLGRRRVLVAGTAVFALASLGSALAPSAGVMVGTRAAEGLAAAFVVPMTLALLSSVFPAGPGRNRAFAVWGGVSAAAGTLGLVLGGVLVTAVGWRWIFLVNLPVGALVVAAALRLLPADDPRPLGGRGGFDVGGAVSVTAGTSLLAYAVVQTGGHPWGSVRTVTLLAAAATLIGYFVIHERFVARSPLMPLALWRNRSVAGADIVSALTASALFAVFYSTTLYMQQVLHYSALRTGLAYVPFGLSILVAAVVAPALVSLAGIRLTTIAGALTSVIGFALLARVPADGRLLTDIIVPTVVVGLGGGLMIVPTSIAAMSGVAAAGHGVASALLNVSRQLGGALGLAAISAVVASVTARSAAAGDGSPAALTAGFHAGFAISAGLIGVSVLTAAALLREEGRGERVNLIELQAGEQPAGRWAGWIDYIRWVWRAPGGAGEEHSSMPGALDARDRDEAMRKLAAGPLDVLVIGGGITGAGAALDAASRGLRVGLVEARDLAAGTSSRSSKLIHGGLRYLEQGDFKLVKEALRERDLLVSRLAPHLVRPVPFLYPLYRKVVERPYVGAGLVIYDALEGIKRPVPHHRHLTIRGALRRAPALRPDRLAGAMLYYDAQVDDARYTVTVARTAVRHGATVLTRASAVSLLRDGSRVVGARVRDEESGRTFDVAATSTVVCAGVWSDPVFAASGVRAGYQVRMSKGVHLVMPRSAIESETGMIIRTSKSVLFFIPNGDRWIVGTTDTEWSGDRAEPGATAEDVDYILGEANRVLARPLSRADVLAVYAGLRPLVAEPAPVKDAKHSDGKGGGDGGSEKPTTKLSREHVVDAPLPGLVSIAGGKFTTYRLMAKDVVDAAVENFPRPVPPSVTGELPLLGADGLPASAPRRSD